MAFNFIGMLIWDDVTIYAPNNTGLGYAFGFLLGAGGFLGLATRITLSILAGK